MNNSVFKLIFVIIVDIIVVIAMVAPIVKELLRIRRIWVRRKFAPGVVTGVREEKDLDRYNQYAKVIEFKTELNETVVFESQEYMYQKPTIGSRVKILYDKENPGNAIEDFHKAIIFKLFLLAFVFVITKTVIEDLLK